ncbi:MAG: ATP-binding cassette domain-containing protein [Sandaracinus sp.]|nr:ATP-binding cassette domain-containing protein [Sandaracinus sp.]
MSRTFLVPEVVQTSAMDCGPAALKSLLGGFGISLHYGRLREACQTDVDGTSIDTLEELAVAFGLDAEQVVVPADHVFLPEAQVLPAVALVRLPTGLTHFVVIWRRVGPFVQVMDPGTGRHWTTWRALREQLFVHTLPVPADAFRAFAGSPAFLAPLEARMGAIGVNATRRASLVAQACEDATWRALATLDAAVRLVSSLVRADALRTGDEATRLLETIVDEPEGIPEELWTARAHDDEHVLLRGAVLVRASERRSTPETTTWPAERRAALEARPTRPLARLWATMREDGLVAPLALGLALVLGASGVALEALLFRALADASPLLPLTEQRVGLSAALVVFLLALLVVQLPVSLATAKLGRHLEARLRLAFLQKIPRLADRYFHSRLTSDMAQRAHGLDGLRSLPALGARWISGVCALLATSGALIALDPARWPAVVAVAVLSVVLPSSLQPLLDERDLRVQTHLGALSRFYLDALLGLVPVRAHGAERALMREHEGLLVEWERASLRLVSVGVLLDLVTATSGVVLTVWLAWSYVGDGGAPAGVLLLVYWALRIPALGQDVAQTARRYPHLRNVVVRLLEPLDAPEEAPSGEAEAPTQAPRLVFEGVSVQAGGHALLADVDLAIAPGSRVAIVGASGAGKSTLVGLLLGWHVPARGRVLVDGVPLDATTTSALRRATAWVDPSVQLWNRSLVSNLRYGSEGDESPMGGVLEAADLIDLLERLPEGLQTELGEGGALVSGGEGQRVRLGRALMRPDARLAILDEPFRGLDRATRRRLLHGALDHFADATVLCVTHDVGDTSAFDRVLVVEDGRVVEDGAPATLLANEGSRYRALVEADAALRESLWSDGAFRRLRLERGTLVESRPSRTSSRPEAHGSHDEHPVAPRVEEVA